MTTAITTAAIEVTNFNNQELVNKWIAYAQVSASSVKSYTKGIRRLFDYCTENNFTAPSRELLIAYREYLALKYAAATANLYLTAAKLFFNFLQLEGYISVNPADRVKGLKISRGHKKDALTPDAVKNILNHFDTATLKGKRDQAIFALMATAGLRTIEVARANVGDIVEVGVQKFLLVQGKGHSEKDARVRIADGVYNLIQEYLAERGTQDADSALFGSLSNRNFDGRLSTNSVSRIVKTAMKVAGYNSKRLTAHSLRHTAATVAIKAGATLRQVQQVLRHISIATTQIYLHELDRVNNVAECLTAAQFGL